MWTEENTAGKLISHDEPANYHGKPSTVAKELARTTTQQKVLQDVCQHMKKIKNSHWILYWGRILFECIYKPATLIQTDKIKICVRDTAVKHEAGMHKSFQSPCSFIFWMDLRQYYALVYMFLFPEVIMLCGKVMKNKRR